MIDAIFLSSVARARILQDEISVREEELKLLKIAVKNYMIDKNLEEATVDDIPVVRYEVKGRTTIDRDALLDRGVTADVLADCTKVANPSMALRLQPSKKM